jgi:E3 ubiquitin-protein ligase DCST1
MFIFVCRGLRALVLKLAYRFEFVGDLLFGQREKRKTIKIILSGVCGAVYGLLLHKFILYSFNVHLGFLASALTHALFALLFANLSAFSVQFRCILMLILLEGFGKAGRNILKALVIFLILTGSVSNIVSNCKEVARVFECTAFLTYNLTKTKFNLVVKPFTNALAGIDLSEVNASFQQITNVIHPIVHEIETSFSRKRLVY